MCQGPQREKDYPSKISELQAQLYLPFVYKERMLNNNLLVLTIHTHKSNTKQIIEKKLYETSMRKSKDRKEKKRKDVQHFVLSEKREEKRKKSMSLWFFSFFFLLFVH